VGLVGAAIYARFSLVRGLKRAGNGRGRSIQRIAGDICSR
jgi:hypothetical protein